MPPGLGFVPRDGAVAVPAAPACLTRSPRAGRSWAWGSPGKSCPALPPYGMGTDVRTWQSPGSLPPGTWHPALSHPCPRTPCPVLRVRSCTDPHPGSAPVWAHAQGLASLTTLPGVGGGPVQTHAHVWGPTQPLAPLWGSRTAPTHGLGSGTQRPDPPAHGPSPRQSGRGRWGETEAQLNSRDTPNPNGVSAPKPPRVHRPLLLLPFHHVPPCAPSVPCHLPCPLSPPVTSCVSPVSPVTPCVPCPPHTPAAAPGQRRGTTARGRPARTPPSPIPLPGQPRRVPGVRTPPSEPPQPRPPPAPARSL